MKSKAMIILMLLLLLGASSTLYADSLDEPGKIAFVSIMKGKNHDIFLINDDGTGLNQLTDSSYDDRDPIWSPDGSRILYFSVDYNFWNSKVQLWIMDQDGGNKIKLAQDVTYDETPQWSPDGKWVLFIDDDTKRLVVADALTGETQYLTVEETEYPSWSVDGTKILCTIEVDGDQGIYLVDRTSLEKELVVDTKGKYYEPSWSPDGNKIAFRYSAPLFAKQKSGMYVIDLVEDTGVYLGKGEQISWSLDGKTIVFVHKIEEWLNNAKPDESNPDRLGTYLINVNGQGSPMKLTEKLNVPNIPVWSPDGEKLAYIEKFKVLVRKSGDPEVYRYDVPYAMNELSNLVWSADSERILCVGYPKLISKASLYILDTTDGSVTRLTDRPYDDYHGVWAPTN